MLYLIDGYNLLFTGGRRRPRGARDLEAARDELVSLLTRFHATRPGRSILVFDARTDAALFGLPRRQRRGAVEVRFAPPGRTADDLLRDLVAETKDARGTTLVTSDREILDPAKARGMRVAGAREFWETLAGPSRGKRPQAPPEPRGKSEGLSTGEVDYWMKEFGIERDEPV